MRRVDMIGDELQTSNVSIAIGSTIAPTQPNSQKYLYTAKSTS